MKQRDDGFEAARQKVLDAALERAPFDGWTPLLMRAAAGEAGVSSSVMDAAFPNGVGDLLALWSDRLDRMMVAAIEGPDLPAKVRDKVAFAVRRRLGALRPHKEAARRAAATLALPIYAPLAAKLVWNTADAVWRALGDSSADFNFYSKRAILSAVWATTFTRWLGDDGADETPTNEFLAARIENVMQFEKAKAKMRDRGVDIEKAVEQLGRLRYSAHPNASRDREARIDDALKSSFPASDPPYWTP
jgi:ubiquinone biosynthesis protein COQ9